MRRTSYILINSSLMNFNSNLLNMKATLFIFHSLENAIVCLFRTYVADGFTGHGLGAGHGSALGFTAAGRIVVVRIE